MLACIYLSYIFSIVCGVNIYIYLGSYFVVHSTYFLLFVVPALTSLYCCPHNSLSSASLKSSCGQEPGALPLLRRPPTSSYLGPGTKPPVVTAW